MKYPKIEIDTRMFYKLGCWCFGIIALANTFGFGVSYSTIVNKFYVISSLAGIIFNYALFGFFLYLYRQLPPPNVVVTDEEFKALLNSNSK